MSAALARIHSLVDAVVFGNGWLALGGLALVVGLAVAVRLLPPLRV
ncbi:hypothetical protein [Arthrobacter sp. NEB 688]|nr:hypothetical protein [Arthrobacter sp. NEB 688]QKE83637.1 hypothetical protein HL663_06590 [Arthrobacter sp. NEB 688]